MGAPKGNQFWKLGPQPGRPPAFKSPEEMWEKAIEYFQWAQDTPLEDYAVMKDPNTGALKQTKVKKRRALTVWGLCNYLGISQETLYDYKKKKDFSEIVKRIFDVMHQEKVECALTGIYKDSLVARLVKLPEKHEISGDPDNPLVVVEGHRKSIAAKMEAARQAALRRKAKGED